MGVRKDLYQPSQDGTGKKLQKRCCLIFCYENILCCALFGGSGLIYSTTVGARNLEVVSCSVSNLSLDELNAFDDDNCITHIKDENNLTEESKFAYKVLCSMLAFREFGGDLFTDTSEIAEIRSNASSSRNRQNNSQGVRGNQKVSVRYIHLTNKGKSIIEIHNRHKTLCSTDRNYITKCWPRRGCLQKMKKTGTSRYMPPCICWRHKPVIEECESINMYLP